MSILVDLMQATMATQAKQLYGTVLSTPTLLSGLGYVCDVNVNYAINNAYENVNWWQSVIPEPGSDTVTGQWTVPPLRNVPISSNNNSLIYAGIGMGVILQQTNTGTYQITGFATNGAGTYTTISVCLSQNTQGNPEDISLTSRLLTLGELADYGGGFGFCPFGAIGIFQGGILLRITT
jgi:hypothetical protein